MVISLLFESPLLFFIFVLSIIFALTVHEYGHALSSYLLGDPTAKEMGRLSLNPLAHIDPWGFLMLLLVGFGWGKPVPFNPYNLKEQRKSPAIIALCGPLANLISIIFFGLILKLIQKSLGAENLLVIFLSWAILINSTLMIFNLLPIPPLDGSKVLYAFVPKGREDIIYKLEQKGPMILIFLIVIDTFLPFSLLDQLFLWVTNFISHIFGIII